MERENALLAKQVWRPIDRFSSLFGRIFKRKYYAHTTFLKAQLGSNQSYTWQSIHDGRKILSKELRWLKRILDCQNAPWIPSSFPFQVVNIRWVNQLIDVVWN